MLIIVQYIHILNHYVVHFNTMLYVNSISIKSGEKIYPNSFFLSSNSLGLQVS